MINVAPPSNLTTYLFNLTTGSIVPSSSTTGTIGPGFGLLFELDASSIGEAKMVTKAILTIYEESGSGYPELYEVDSSYQNVRQIPLFTKTFLGKRAFTSDISETVIRKDAST